MGAIPQRLSSAEVSALCRPMAQGPRKPNADTQTHADAIVSGFFSESARHANRRAQQLRKHLHGQSQIKAVVKRVIQMTHESLCLHLKMTVRFDVTHECSGPAEALLQALELQLVRRPEKLFRLRHAAAGAGQVRPSPVVQFRTDRTESRTLLVEPTAKLVSRAWHMNRRGRRSEPHELLAELLTKLGHRAGQALSQGNPSRCPRSGKEDPPRRVASAPTRTRRPRRVRTSDQAPAIKQTCKAWTR